jgi:hypothetical protein
LVDTNDYKNYIEIPVASIKRAILDIASSDELQNLDYKKDDQLRIRVKLTNQSLSQYPVEEEKIRGWASEKEIVLVSLEASLAGDGISTQTEKDITELEVMKPDDVVKVFSQQEQLSQDIVDMGLELVKESVR